jgi:homoserine kinase
MSAGRLPPDGVTVFAPATTGNVAVGFDILGFALGGFGDTVTVNRIAEPTVRIAAIEGSSEPLPLEAAKNTAGIVLLDLLAALELPFGFELIIHKGIPLGSGLGGSAASAVGALTGANALLPVPLPKTELFRFALAGERLAGGGAAHGDNLAPGFLGGLVLVRCLQPPDLIRIPVPPPIRVAMVHPRFRLDTEKARGILRREVSLSDFVAQTGNLAAFVSACYTEDLDLIGRSLMDLVIEPQRAQLIPGFAAARNAALAAGALGCSISGAGPSMFAFCRSDETARQVAGRMADALFQAGLTSDLWTGPISPTGAQVIAERYGSEP